jgi:hypothetical protein
MKNKSLLIEIGNKGQVNGLSDVCCASSNNVRTPGVSGSVLIINKWGHGQTHAPVNILQVF